jgi:hypothetical protein
MGLALNKAFTGASAKRPVFVGFGGNAQKNAQPPDPVTAGERLLRRRHGKVDIARVALRHQRLRFAVASSLWLRSSTDGISELAVDAGKFANAREHSVRVGLAIARAAPALGRAGCALRR